MIGFVFIFCICVGVCVLIYLWLLLFVVTRLLGFADEFGWFAA